MSETFLLTSCRFLMAFYEDIKILHCFHDVYMGFPVSFHLLFAPLCFILRVSSERFALLRGKPVAKASGRGELLRWMMDQFVKFDVQAVL